MAGVKITDLEVLLESASDDLLYIVDVSDTTQSPEGTSKAIEVGNVGRPYKVYTALLTQTATSIPTAIELENTLGAISYSYQGTGLYRVNSINLFVSNKTAVFLSPLHNTSFDGVSAIYQASNSEIYISTFIASSGVYTNALLNNTSIEIRVYN